MAYTIPRLDRHDYGGVTVWISVDGADPVALYVNPQLCEQFAAQGGYPIEEINRDAPPEAAVAWAESVLLPMAAERLLQERLAVAMGTLAEDAAMRLHGLRASTEAQLRANPTLDPATLTAGVRAAFVEGLG